MEEDVEEEVEEEVEDEEVKEGEEELVAYSRRGGH